MVFVSNLIENMFCGSVAGIGSCISGYPLDTIKPRMQLQKIGFIQCFRLILKNEGFMALFNGMYFPLLVVPFLNAISFGSYQLFKKINNNYSLSFQSGLKAGVFSGIITSFVINPVELVKIRMQVGTHNYFNSTQCLKNILKNEGIKGIYKGMFTTIIRQIPKSGIQFATYQTMKQFFLKNGQYRQLLSIEAIITGGIVGVIGWSFVYPLDVIKTHLQNNKQMYKIHKWIPDGGFYQCGKHIIANKGLTGLVSGYEPLLLRAFIATSFNILCYQKLHRLFNFFKKSKFY